MRVTQTLSSAFVREQPALTPEDFKSEWMDDDEACAVFAYAKERGGEQRIFPRYVVSDAIVATIVEIAGTVVPPT